MCLNPVTAVPVDPDNGRRDIVLKAVLVSRFLTPLPIVIIIEDESAARTKERIQILQTDASGFIPIPVQPQQSERPEVRNGSGDRFLKPSNVEMDVAGVETESIKKQGADFVEGSVAFGNRSETALGSSAAVVCGFRTVQGTWLRQPFKRIEEMQWPSLTRALERAPHDATGSSSPDAAFDKGPRDRPLGQSMAKVPEFFTTRKPGHGVIANLEERARAVPNRQASNKPIPAPVGKVVFES